MCPNDMSLMEAIYTKVLRSDTHIVKASGKGCLYNKLKSIQTLLLHCIDIKETFKSVHNKQRIQYTWCMQPLKKIKQFDFNGPPLITRIALRNILLTRIWFTICQNWTVF